MQGKSVTRLPFNLTWKAILAFVFPVVAAAATAGASWIVSGDFDATEVRAAAGGVALAAVAALGAYVGKPGMVVQRPRKMDR